MFFAAATVVHDPLVPPFRMEFRGRQHKLSQRNLLPFGTGFRRKNPFSPEKKTGLRDVAAT